MKVILFIFLVVVAVLLCIYIDNKLNKNPRSEESEEEKTKDEKKVEAAYKEGYSGFKQQLDQLVLSKEETIKREEEKERQAQEEKRKRLEEEKKALENKIMRANTQADMYLRLVKAKILNEAKIKKFGVGDKIVVQLPLPEHIKLYCRVVNVFVASTKGVFPEDEQWFRFFMDALKEKGAKDNVSFVAMGRPISKMLGHKAYYRMDYAPHPSTVEVYGTFTCRCDAERNLNGYMECTCHIVDNSKGQ